MRAAIYVANSLADKILGADGMAVIGPAACPPVSHEAGGAHEGLEALRLADGGELPSP